MSTIFLQLHWHDPDWPLPLVRIKFTNPAFETGGYASTLHDALHGIVPRGYFASAVRPGLPYMPNCSAAHLYLFDLAEENKYLLAKIKSETTALLKQGTSIAVREWQHRHGINELDKGNIGFLVVVMSADIALIDSATA